MNRYRQSATGARPEETLSIVASPEPGFVSSAAQPEVAMLRRPARRSTVRSVSRLRVRIQRRYPPRSGPSANDPLAGVAKKKGPQKRAVFEWGEILSDLS